MAALITVSLCGMTAVPEDVETRQDGEKMEIIKVYHLSPEEDPQLLIEEPFEQDGYEYQYESMVKEEETTENKKLAEKTITLETDTNDLEAILQQVEGSIPYDEGDGYTGTLTLDPSSIKTEAAGYATSSYTVSDTRTYTDLAYNDSSLIPQTVQKNGMTLSLSSVSWQGQGGTGANGSLIPTSYTATAYYSGVGSRTYATGYVTEAKYSGEVTQTETENIYTLTYSGKLIPPPEPEEEEPDWTMLGFLAAGVTVALILIAVVLASFIREIRKNKKEAAVSVPSDESDWTVIVPKGQATQPPQDFTQGKTEDKPAPEK